MKKALTIIVALFCTLALITPALAGTVEFQSKHVGSPAVWKHTVTVGFGEQLSPRFGWTGFVLSSNTWGEAYFGPTYSPAPWITVAGCAGIQDDPQKSRFASWVFMTHGDFSGFYVKETGAGDWHKMLISYTTNFGKIQLWNQTALGTGPRVEIKLLGKKTRLSAYAGLMFDDNLTNSAIGVIKAF